MLPIAVLGTALALAAAPGSPFPSAPPVTPVSVVQDDQEAEGEPMTQARLEEIAREIEAEVAELRGAPFERPVRVKVADKAELMEYLRKRMEMEYGPGELEAEADTAKLLGLIPEDMDLLAEITRLLDSQVGGYYDPDEDAFYLMKRFSDTGLTRTIISHELTHALDDQLHGIDRILAEVGDDNDRKLAFHAVVEGSGTSVMNEWSAAKLKSGELSMSEMMDAADFGMDDLATMPEFIWKPMMAAYLRGQTFLSRTESMMAAGLNPATGADIDQAFRDPPRSTEQVLHPAKYWKAEERDEPLNVHLELDRMPEGWNVLREQTMGEMGLAMVCTPMDERAVIDPSNKFSILGIKYTNDAAEGWGGDRVVLFGRGEEQLLVGATMWDTAEDAVEFREALGKVGIAAVASGVEPKAVFYHVGRGLDAPTAARLAGLVAFHIDA